MTAPDSGTVGGTFGGTFGGTAGEAGDRSVGSQVVGTEGSTASVLRRIGVAARYSEAAVFQGVVYLAGMVPERGDTDIGGQTADVLAQVAQRLQEAGSDKTRLLRVQIFLADIADISAMNAVWDAWVPPGDAPPRATVQAALADPAWKIEVVATAALCEPGEPPR